MLSVVLYFLLLNLTHASLVEDLSKKDIDEKIKLLGKIDINSDQVKLSLMSDLEGTSIILKVKDLEGKKLAVFKPSSGSTNHRGEYVMFKLGNMIGFNIYPPTTITYLTPTTLEKVKALLKNIKFNKFYGKKHILHMKRKEKNRKIMLKKLNRYIKANKNLYGALKSWVNNFQFYKPLGSKIGFKNHKIYKYLKSSNPQPEHKPFRIRQCTKLLKPYGCSIGKAYIDDLAKDMSSMLVVDAIVGNRDRFPGGNIHFRALTEEVENREDAVIFPIARLLSLDNGAVLGPNNKTALNMLRKNISRFVKKHVTKLNEIYNTKELKSQRKEFGLTRKEFKTFRKNLKSVINYIRALEKKYKDKIWFTYDLKSPNTRLPSSVTLTTLRTFIS